MKIKPLLFSIVLALFTNISESLYARPRTVCDESSLRAALTNGGLIKFGCDGTIVLSRTLQITTNSILDGTGHSVVISGGDAVRVFFVATNVDFALTNLTIIQGRQKGTNGIVAANSASGGRAFGAGIYNDGGRVMLTGCTLSNNVAMGGNAAAYYNQLRQSGGDAFGAAIYNNCGSISMNNSMISSNLCVTGKGVDSFASADTEPGFAGGPGIYSGFGLITISNTRFENNRALGSDGSSGPFDEALPGSAFGGAMVVVGGDLILTRADFSNNAAIGGYIPPSGTLHGSFAQGGALYLTNCSARISQSHFRANSALSGSIGNFGLVKPAQGGAIFCAATLLLQDDLIADNLSLGGSGNDLKLHDGGAEADGGAIFNRGSLSIQRCLLKNNKVLGGAGYGVFLGPARGGNGKGAGVYNLGDLSVVDSILAFNQASGGSGLTQPSTSGGFFDIRGGHGQGGGIFNEGDLHGTNITFVSNSGAGGSVDGPSYSLPYKLQGGDGNGGAIFNQGRLTLVHSTLASNTVDAGGPIFRMGVATGGALFTTNGSSQLQNTIVANSLSGGNSFGPLIDDGNNLSSDGSCQFTASGSLNNLDPLLSSLGDFGGPTPTMALLAGSPAMNHGLAIYCPTTDQRGIARPFGAGCDIGAFESAPPYSVHGMILGSSLVGPVTIAEGTNVTTVAAPGLYSVSGFSAGTYKITLSASNGVIIPNSRSVTVNSDVSGVDFRAYQLNALLLESYTNQVLHLIFTGTSGQTSRMQVTTKLADWVTAGTNYMQANGVFDFYFTNNLTEGSRFFRAVSP